MFWAWGVISVEGVEFWLCLVEMSGFCRSFAKLGDLWLFLITRHLVCGVPGTGL